MPRSRMVPSPIDLASLLAALIAWGASATPVPASDERAGRPRLPPGVEIEYALFSDLVAAWRGGERIGSGAAWLADLVAELDTRAAGLWRGGRFRVYLAGTTGAEPSVFIGDVQGTSNIEAAEAIWLHDLLYEHSSADGSWSVLIGLHDVNSEFAAPDHAADTLHSSLSFAPGLSQPGLSTYPSTAPGARLRVRRPGGFELAVGVYDGVAGDPLDPTGTAIILRGEEGAYFVAEAGTRVRPGGGRELRLAGGAWHLDRQIDLFLGGSRDGTTGTYGIFEWRQPVSRGARFWSSVQLGHASADANVIDAFLGAAAGLEPGSGRVESLHLGVARAGSSARWRTATGRTGRHETAIEAAVKIRIAPWLTAQPFLQSVSGAGFDSRTRDATILGLRVTAGP